MSDMEGLDIEGNVKILDGYRPHNTAKVECRKCSKFWVATYDARATELECPQCHFMNEIDWD